MPPVNPDGAIMSRIGTEEAAAVTCANPGIGHAAYRRRPKADRAVLAPDRAGSRLAAARDRFAALRARFRHGSPRPTGTG
jgi:hypothetical protein